MNYYILASGWIIYFALHSLLASVGVKDWASKLLGSGYRYYRLLYSIISTVGLVGLLILNGSIPAAYFFDNTGLVRYLSILFITFGVMTIQVAFRQYRFKSFMGLAQEIPELKVEGILKYIRHPILSGLGLVTIGFFLFIPNLPSLISCLGIGLYVPVGMYLEEKKLIKIFGEKYLHYRESVPALIPRLPIR